VKIELVMIIVTAVISILTFIWFVVWEIFKYRKGKKRHKGEEQKLELEMKQLKDDAQERKSLIQKPTPEEVELFSWSGRALYRDKHRMRSAIIVPFLGFLGLILYFLLRFIF